MDSWAKKRTAWLAGHWVWVKWLENQQSWEACRYTLWKWELCVKVFVLHHHQRASAMEDGLNSQVVKMTQTLTLPAAVIGIIPSPKVKYQDPRTRGGPRRESCLDFSFTCYLAIAASWRRNAGTKIVNYMGMEATCSCSLLVPSSPVHAQSCIYLFHFKADGYKISWLYDLLDLS